jgi:ElaB/YqjD/DUF883 family membrane-anchored ribosome-binding protein
MTTPAQAARLKIVEDFKALTSDAEELLRATANQTGERVSAARTRVEERLREAQEAMKELGEDVFERSRHAAQSADRTVRDHPWESVAIAAAVGFLLGLLTSRR